MLDILDESEFTIHQPVCFETGMGLKTRIQLTLYHPSIVSIRKFEMNSNFIPLKVNLKSYRKNATTVFMFYVYQRP